MVLWQYLTPSQHSPEGLSKDSPRSVAEGGAEGAMSDRRERAGAPAQGRRLGGTQLSS